MYSEEQELAIKSTSRDTLIAAAAGSGKAQPYDTVIPTPTGKKQLRDLVIGDYVFDRQGKPTKVLGIFPQGQIDCYKVTLKDGRFTFCGKEHIWTCVNRSTNKFYDITVEDMLKNNLQDTSRRYIYNIPNNSAVELPKKQYEIDPYVIGAFLGDGCCLEKYLTISSDDEEIVSEISKLIGATEYYKSCTKNYSWCFKQEKYFNEDTGRERARFYTETFFNKYSDELIQLSEQKRIPEEYKEGSISQRLDLLQGLMDTDGSIYCAENRYTTRFTNTSLTLIKDIQEILWSLGYQSTISKDIREKYKKGICYNLNILIPNEEKSKLFRLKRKKEIAEKAKKYTKNKNYGKISIINIEKMEQKEDMVCIYVENDEHLYLTTDYIVTHNTTTIVGRINYLIKQGVEPDTIYAITFTNMAAQEMLERIDYPIFIGTIHGLANKILQTNGVDTSQTIQDESFDELLEMTKRRHIEMPKITHLLVDELQDIADVEFDFIVNTLRAQSLYFVGDSCQCQPAGTMVRLRNNVFKPIEEIEIGDSVVWYNNEKSYLCGSTTKAWNTKELKVVDKAVRSFVDDNLITITTEKGESSTYTPNHRTFIRLKRTEYEHVVYLMCDSNYRFRIGKISMYSGKGATLPWRTKMLNEGCSKIWLLKAFKTDKEARLLENKLSYQYSIPQTCWQTDKVQWTAADIDFIYSELDTFISAKLCLENFNRNIDFPILDKDSENTCAMHFATNAVSEIYACNIMPDLMECMVYNPELPKNKDYQTITNIEYKYIDTPINVYSLKIEEYGTYVADNIVTHNSIFGFKGGNFHHFLSFLEEPTTAVYELTTNYRNPRKILAFANTFLKGMGDVYRVESHVSREWDGEVYAEPYSMKRIISLIEEDGNYKDWFVLARKNSEVREVISALERAKIPCGTFKKAEKTFEELKQEMQENKVKVLTIHSAKGLEADNVVVIGAKKFNSEEKRICYVAATRARERLYWMTENPVKKEYPRGNRAKMGTYDDSTGATITW